MIFSIENFKVLKNRTSLKTGNINIVTGQNSSGKSTITQAIRLLKENLKVGEDGKLKIDSFQTLDLNKLGIGKFEHVVNRNSKSPYIKFAFKQPDFLSFFHPSKSVLFDTQLVYEQGESPVHAELTKIVIATEINDIKTNVLVISKKEEECFINYSYILQHIQEIALNNKIADTFTTTVKMSNAWEGSGVYLRAEYPRLMEHLEQLLPQLGKINEIKDFTDIEDNTFIVEGEKQSFKFFVGRNQCETGLVNSVGNNTFHDYPLTSLLGKNKKLKFEEVLEQNKAKSSSYTEELLDSLFGQQAEAILEQVQEAEKQIVEKFIQKNSDSFFKSWQLTTRLTKDALPTGLPLDSYLAEELEGAGILNGGQFSFYENDNPSGIKLLLNYLNAFISVTNSYIIQEIETVDYFNGINIDINRTYNLSSETQIVKLLQEGMTFQSNEGWKAFVNRWLKEFDIADDIKIEVSEWGDAIQTLLLKDKQWVNVATEGTGKAKLTFLLIKIANSFTTSFRATPSFSFENLLEVQYGYPIPKILIIEEPEAFLHPNFQSKLANLFVDISGFNPEQPLMLADKPHIAPFIETHSEYLIRKFQYLVAQGSCGHQSIDIRYFKHPADLQPGMEHHYQLEMRKDGILKQDFGTGFIDESVRLTIDLLKLQNQN